MISQEDVHRIAGLLIRVVLAGGLGVFGLFGVFAYGVTPDVLVACLPGFAAILVILAGPDRVLRLGIPVAGLSLALTLWAIVAGDGDRVPMWMGEAGALLVLVAWSVRRWDANVGPAVVTSTSVAMLAITLRAADMVVILAVGMLEIIGLSIAVAVGLYQRSQDKRRQRALAGVRRGERLELARDLHDFVAHHVTGIVVQAQAAQYIPPDDTERARESFKAIEAAGLEALTSMRRLVGVLREEDSGPGSRPTGDLAEIAELVDRFSVGDVYASLYVSPDLAGRVLPPEVGATAHRVVQESLTNIRKHGEAVTTVWVTLSAADGGLEVTVRDDGRAGGGRGGLARWGGGYGLAGLRERVAALDGALRAAPRPEGGWEVVASIPFTGTRGASRGDT
ncbi:signal transduction histidine kinase [Stackebrandtia albiflava]|uniref:histidine kinase n=1 Tax=Stackebrandtia albiflava TaxID=406432 RepID=A0A562V484_9ACTN|nr:histidine kinase [Stackebrandtia albiflava]TWJ12709.1 signal transduction histidine kinase [Stackebrandtia albiflava]